MKADESIAAANGVLRSLGASVPTARKDLLGPELSVAIVVPTYNDSLFLGEALRSVQQQTYENWRCYVVDDASTEDVNAVFSDFEADDRFELLRHGANAGLAAARNTGIRRSTEDVLQFLDADDMLTPWALEKRVVDLRRHWHNPLVAGVHGQVLQCTEEADLDDVETWTHKPNLTTRDWLAADGESPFTVHAPLMRAEVATQLGGFDETFRNGAEDWDFWQRVLRHGYSFAPCQSIVGAYRQRRASMIREHAGIHLGRADELFNAAQEWAIVDHDIAVSNARMPLGDARLAHNRYIRAARWAGINAAQIADLSAGINDEILAFLDPASTVGTRSDNGFRAAKGGIIRGLGLSTHVVKDLDRDTERVIDAAAQSIVDQLMAYCADHEGPPGTLNLVRRHDVDVLILAETAMDVEVMVPLHKLLVDDGLTVGVVDSEYIHGASGSAATWERSNIETIPYNMVALGKVAFNVVVARLPTPPALVEILDLAAARGAHITFLQDETDRELTVEETAEPRVPGTSPDAAGIARLARLPKGEARSVESEIPTFSAVLSVEEDALDDESYEWFEEMRDSRRGETAVIIGNGPSLNEIDLEQLKGIDTFGVNSIFLADDRLPEPLTYYVVEDTAVFKDNAKAIKAYEAEHKLFPTLYRAKFEADEITENTHFFRMNMGFYGRTSPWGPTGTLCYPRFSTDASQRVFCGQSVTIINLQLAHWFGYDRILLIGMDFSYEIPSDAERNGNIIVSRSDDPNHFHPDYFGPGKTWKDPKLDRVLINYRLAREIYETTGRTIVNCTVGGRLELFPRMTLDEALGGH